MAKKRSCRRTADEDKIHEKAVKMRKMTDEQLCKYIDDTQGKNDTRDKSVSKFLTCVADSSHVFNDALVTASVNTSPYHIFLIPINGFIIFSI